MNHDSLYETFDIKLSLPGQPRGLISIGHADSSTIVHLQISVETMTASRKGVALHGIRFIQRTHDLGYAYVRRRLFEFDFLSHIKTGPLPIWKLIAYTTWHAIQDNDQCLPLWPCVLH